MKRTFCRTVVCVFLPCLIFAAGCSSKKTAAESNVSLYDESRRAADAAFKELDGESAGKGRSLDGFSETGAGAHLKENESGGGRREEKAGPSPVVEKRRPVADALYPIVNGYPIWVTEPYAEGYRYVAVGAAGKNAGSPALQKKAARIQAMGELSRMIEVEIDNEIFSEKSSDGRGGAASDIKMSSRQRSDGLLNSVTELDSWTDSENGDFYLLLGIKGE